jgi:hypothetical protein
MSTFVRQYQDLKINTVLDRKPMKTFEDWCDVLPATGSGNQPGCSVLDHLQLVDEFIICASKQTIAVD